MKPDAEVRLDGILKRAIPLILFSYDAHRKPLIEKLNHLYSSFVADDSNIFEELHMQISNLIDNREILDSNRERLIESFSNRTKTYDERLREHDELMKLFKKNLGKITTNRQYINKMKEEIEKIKYQKNPSQNQYNLSKEKKEKSAPSPIKKNEMILLCPICGETLHRNMTKENGISIYYCSTKEKRYNHWVQRKEDGSYFNCENCNSVMLGSGKTLICSNCGNKEKVIE